MTVWGWSFWSLHAVVDLLGFPHGVLCQSSGSPAACVAKFDDEEVPFWISQIPFLDVSADVWVFSHRGGFKPWTCGPF